MYTIIRKSALSLAMLLPAVVGWSQASAPAMPAAVLNLNRFNGTWEANVTSVMGEKSYQFDYSMKCMPVAGGSGAYWEESGNDPAMGDMHASDLFGYDRTDGRLHCFSVDNMGSTHDRIADWKTPDHLVLVYNGIENGKQIAEKLDFTMKSDSIIDFTGNETIDGRTEWSGTGTLHKAEEK